MMTRALALACAALLGATPCAAQSRWDVSFAATGGYEIVRRRDGPVRDRLSGAVLAGAVDVARGRFVARAHYAQGRVTGDTAARDVVEGELLLGVRARPWLTLWLGPHARTFTPPGTDMSDFRWLLLSGRATARGSVFPGRVESFVEAWYGLAGRLSRPSEAADGQGAEAGLALRHPSRPLSARIAYRVEQARAGDRRVTVEALNLTIRYGLGR